MNASENVVKNQLESKGYKVFKKGIPDFLVIKNGKLCFVEVKTKGSPVLSKEQKEVHRYLRVMGYDVEVIKVDNPIIADLVPDIEWKGEKYPLFRCKVEGNRAVFKCPVCSQKNYHGIPDEPEPRMSHCRCWPKGYFIVLDSFHLGILGGRIS